MDALFCQYRIFPPRDPLVFTPLNFFFGGPRSLPASVLFLYNFGLPPFLLIWNRGKTSPFVHSFQRPGDIFSLFPLIPSQASAGLLNSEVLFSPFLSPLKSLFSPIWLNLFFPPTLNGPGTRLQDHHVFLLWALSSNVFPRRFLLV